MAGSTCGCSMTGQLPRAAYIHVPFCRHRCGYCNFSVAAGRDDLQTNYLDALEKELERLGSPVPIETLFVGGGTPTQLASQNLKRLCRLIRTWFVFDPRLEWTVEANPEDISPSTLQVLADAGVTRLSLGVQSFDRRKLELLERTHSGPSALRAVHLARKQFSSVSIDLMFGVPGETLDTWHEDLSIACDLALQHISIYGLTIEKGTRFWARRERAQLILPSEATQRIMFEEAIDRLVSSGWQHYEISNFARPGLQCRHNLVYWMGDSYYGFGPGAARYINGRRETNHGSPTTYLQRMLAGQCPVAEFDDLEPAERAREQLIFQLRLMAGVSASEFERRTGHHPHDLAGPAIDKYLQLKLLEYRDGRLRLTREGLMVSDTMWPDFL